MTFIILHLVKLRAEDEAGHTELLPLHLQPRLTLFPPRSVAPSLPSHTWLATPPAFRSSEVMGSLLFKHNSWAQRDHLVSWQFGIRGDGDQAECADSGLNLFVRHSKQSAAWLQPKQAALCARINKWMSFALKCDLAWHSYVSNKMIFALFGLSRMSSSEEPAGKTLPCTPWWMFSVCVLLMHVFFFFSLLQGLAAIYFLPYISPPCWDQPHELLSLLSCPKLTI